MITTSLASPMCPVQSPSPHEDSMTLSETAKAAHRSWSHMPNRPRLLLLLRNLSTISQRMFRRRVGRQLFKVVWLVCRCCRRGRGLLDLRIGLVLCLEVHCFAFSCGFRQLALRVLFRNRFGCENDASCYDAGHCKYCDGPWWAWMEKIGDRRLGDSHKKVESRTQPPRWRK